MELSISSSTNEMTVRVSNVLSITNKSLLIEGVIRLLSKVQKGEAKLLGSKQNVLTILIDESV